MPGEARAGCQIEGGVNMTTAKEWLDKHNIDLNKIHGNIGDYDGNIFIETKDGWIFWNAQGIIEEVETCI